MTDKEKIRAEVERRYKWYQDEITKYMPHMVPDYEAKKEECKSILDFIDSLFKEPVKIKKGCKYRSVSNVTNNDTGNICFVAGKIYLAPKDDTLVSEENGWLCDVSENSSNFELVEELESEDLEEAAKNHAAERYRTTRSEFLAIKCKWSFITGAKWDKKQMMKGAIDGLVICDDILTHGYRDIVFKFPDNLQVGDKVKMIILKDE